MKNILFYFLIVLPIMALLSWFTLHLCYFFFGYYEFKNTPENIQTFVFFTIFILLILLIYLCFKYRYYPYHNKEEYLEAKSKKRFERLNKTK